MVAQFVVGRLVSVVRTRLAGAVVAARVLVAPVWPGAGGVVSIVIPVGGRKLSLAAGSSRAACERLVAFEPGIRADPVSASPERLSAPLPIRPGSGVRSGACCRRAVVWGLTIALDHEPAGAGRDRACAQQRSTSLEESRSSAPPAIVSPTRSGPAARMSATASQRSAQTGTSTPHASRRRVRDRGLAAARSESSRSCGAHLLVAPALELVRD
jgi:hypothetical protein